MGFIFYCQGLICVKDRMYTLGFGQVLCFQAVLYRWDMLGFIFGWQMMGIVSLSGGSIFSGSGNLERESLTTA